MLIGRKSVSTRSTQVGCVPPTSVASARCRYQGLGICILIPPLPPKGPGTRDIYPRGQTYASENITFPQLRWWAVKMARSHLGWNLNLDPNLCSEKNILQ